MDQNLYRQFVDEQRSGLKACAKDTVKRFVESFVDDAERCRWTHEFLPTLKSGNVVRHEIYESVIFPVLLKGYQQREAMSLYWLAATMQNLFKAPHLYEKIGWEQPEHLLKSAYAAAQSSNEIRGRLLDALIDKFEYLTHEGAGGVLYGPDEPWQTQYWSVMSDLKLARDLDASGRYSTELDVFEKAVAADRTRQLGSG